MHNYFLLLLLFLLLYYYYYCYIIVIIITIIITFISGSTNSSSSNSTSSSVNCVENVCIQSYSGPYFPAFGQTTERFSVSLHIQSECGKIRTRITPNTGTIYTVIIIFMNIISSGSINSISVLLPASTSVIFSL